MEVTVEATVEATEVIVYIILETAYQLGTKDDQVLATPTVAKVLHPPATGAARQDLRREAV